MSIDKDQLVGLNANENKQVYMQMTFPIISENTNGCDGEEEQNLISGLFTLLKSFPGIPIQNKLASIDYIKKVLENYL